MRTVVLFTSNKCDRSLHTNDANTAADNVCRRLFVTCSVGHIGISKKKTKSLHSDHFLEDRISQMRIEEEIWAKGIGGRGTGRRKKRRKD